MKTIDVPAGSFSRVGSPSWSNVSYIAIRTSNVLPNSWSIGDVGLSFKSRSFDLDSDDVAYFRSHLSSTDNRYIEQTKTDKENSEVILILTPRTVQWFEQDGISGIKSVLEGPVDPIFLELVKKNTLLELIYSYEDNVYIFKVN